MFPRILYGCLLASWLTNDVNVLAIKESTFGRDEKHFSLFSVVTFKNLECTSESSLTGGARKGTCYTTTECSDKSGTSSGNCASGFGVCCVFLAKTGASATIKENRTHIRNSEYPSTATATATTSIVYTINKMQSDICQIRLDFTQFVIAGPANSLENVPASSGTYNTHCVNDLLTITSTSHTGLLPYMCGILTGQHIYLELSPASSDAGTVTIATSTTANQPTPAVAKRIWDFQASQIPCYATYRAPNGCHRWFTTTYGKITSLNFYKVSGSTPAANAQNSGIELASQYLNTCIRRAKGMCCTEYQVCLVDSQSITLTDLEGTDGDTGTQGTFNEGWSIDIDTTPFITEGTMADVGMFDAQCSGDYVEIPSSWSGKCGPYSGMSTVVNSRYCGARFGANYQATEATNTDMPVCDCSEPFSLRHGSDMSNDEGGTEANEADNTNVANAPRGFCLDFQQIPCYH